MSHRLHVALALLLAAAGALVVVRIDREDAPRGASPTTTTMTSATTTGCATTTTEPATTTTSATTTTAPPPPATVPALRPGDRGRDVLAIEQRLDGLGYFVGAVDGTYDDDTVHGVTAFQKVQGLGRDGIVGPATERALVAARRPTPRGVEGRLLEVDLTRQVMLAVEGGKVQKVLDVSTGKTPGLTPTGRFTLYRQIDGWRHAPLGVLYRPKYYWKGLAIHGYSSVPAFPASHGCIRVTNPEMDWLWSSGFADLGTVVWIY